MKISQIESFQIKNHRAKAKEFREDYILTIASPLIVMMIVQVIEEDISTEYRLLNEIMLGLESHTKEERILLYNDLKSSNIDPLIHEKKIWEAHYQLLKNSKIHSTEDPPKKNKSDKQYRSFQLKDQTLIRLLYLGMIGTLISDETTTFQFENAFNGEPFVHGQIKWKKSSRLLAYFIEELRLNHFIPIDSDLWAIGNTIFDKGKALAVAKDQYLNNKNHRPKFFQLIDELLKPLIPLNR